MIKIENLSKNYGELNVLNSVNLHIAESKIHALVGMSGAGKSTLLRTINGIEDFNGGSLYVMGQNVQQLEKKEMSHFRRNIGMIFQNFALMERKTVFQNIAFPLESWHMPKNDIKERVDELLEMLKIVEKKDEKPRNLSGGQRQRVAIARALALEPKILLCDEATSGLDPQTTKNILKILLEINNNLGITIVIVTHEMEVAKVICDSISIMTDGHIVENNSVENIFAEQSEALKELIGKNIFSVAPGREVLRLFQGSDAFELPVLNSLSSEGFTYQIEDATIDHGKKGRFATYYISLAQEQFNAAYAYLKKYGAPEAGFQINKYNPIEGRII